MTHFFPPQDESNEVCAQRAPLRPQPLLVRRGGRACPRLQPKHRCLRPGMNYIKIGLPGKLILGDYFEENMTSQRPFLFLRISFQGRPIFIQLPPVGQRHRQREQRRRRHTQTRQRPRRRRNRYVQGYSSGHGRTLVDI